MTSSDTQEPRGSRKFAWLAAGIVVAILAYTAGWFYVGGRIERSVDDTVQQAIADGGHATCAGRAARGFPFRFGLFCDKVSFSDRPSGVLVEGNGLRTASQVYDPWRIVGELDDVRLRPAAAGAGFGASGLDLRFSAVLDDPLPQRASLSIKNLSVDATTPDGAATPVLRMPAAEAHMRQREGDLDLAVEGKGVSLAPPGMQRGIDLTRLFLDLTLADGVALADAPPASLRGLSIVLREATANLTDTAGVTVSGPLSVRSDGLIDAQLEIKVREAGEIAVRLAEAFPDKADEIRSAMAGFAILGDGTPLPLSIDKGRARIAFVKLGRLPPLD